MAFGIDTTHLGEHWIPDHENHLDEPLGSTGRYIIDRVYARATVIYDPLMIQLLSEARGKPISQAKQAALDWQQDPDDELDEAEVLHHLQQVAETSFPEIFSPNDRTARSYVTFADSPSFSERTGGRPPSDFRRYSIKISILRNDRNGSYGMYLITHTNFQKLFPHVRHGSWCKWGYEPKLSCSNTRHKCAVVWQMQIDFVDRISPNTRPTSRLRKRRRRINPFQQVSLRCVEDTSRGNHLPDAKRKTFKGVRYRPDRKAWVAEMKPPGSKNKASFGDFKSDTEAARAVDVAFHHYGKQLNFADTPQILSTLQTSAGLNAKDKLKLVKEQAKLLASIASSLPSSPTSDLTRAADTVAWVKHFFETPEPSPRGCATDTLGLRSFSEISPSLSCSHTGEADYGVSQPRPWLQPDLMASIMANGVQTMEPNFTATDDAAMANGFQEGQSMFEWSEENAIADYPMDMAITQRPELPVMPPNSCGWSTGSSMQITEPWEHSSGFFTLFGSPSTVDHSCEIQMDSPFLSSPAPMYDQVRSPYCDFQGSFPDRLMLEQ